MTIFRLVKLALDELYAEGTKKYGDKLDETIRQKMAILTASYGELGTTGGAPINYRDSATRFAYVFKYTASHGDYVVQMLEAARKPNNKNLFTTDSMRLSCIGGGPGSDVIGVLKYLSEYSSEPPKKITCYLLDKEQAWADTWTEIGEKIKGSAQLNVHFQPLDVTNPDSWVAQTRFLQADLFTLSYFVSEVYRFRGGPVTDFWKTLFDEAKPGALFLYVDNGAEMFNQYFDSQWRDRNDITADVISDNKPLTPQASEQASELGSYLTKFGQSPKLKSQISFRILRKLAS